jgi:secreted trypsin-like serine protease
MVASTHNSRHEAGQTEVALAVVGGSAAPPGRFEFMGGLFTNREGGGFFCAGTLIAPRIFMTAAHCVVNETTGEPKGATTFWPKVHIGAYNRTQNVGIDVRAIAVTRPHPDFGYADKDIDRKFFNDIAIMLLDRPSTKPHVQLPPFIQKPQLPAATGTPLTALGWGDTRPGTFSPSEPLQQLDLALRPLRVCQQVFPKVPGYRSPENTLICAGNAPGYAANICKGDSGGPLLLLGNGTGTAGSTPDVQLGISSFTHDASVCLGEPAGFTNLAQLGPWIAETIEELVTGRWVGRVYGDANVQTFSGQTYVQKGSAGQQLNIVSSSAYMLSGWLKQQPNVS